MSKVNEFILGHPQAVLTTHRRDGGLQMSPIRVLVDAQGAIVATTRAATAKAKNLLRQSDCAICLMTEGWQGPWLTIEATAEVLTLPLALAGLRELYLQRDGVVASPEDFAEAMAAEGRVLLRFTATRVGGTAETD